MANDSPPVHDFDFTPSTSTFLTVDKAEDVDALAATLAEGGYAVVCDGPDQALAVANAIAPEHLELLVEDAAALLDGVRHAGAVFCG